MVFLQKPSTPQALSPKLHSFCRDPYKIKQVIEEMTSKVCEIETNKEWILNYDCMKPCRSPLGGFVPPTKTASAPMQPPNEFHSNFPTAKNHSCFCEAHLTCTPTIGPVPVSGSVPLLQLSLQTTFCVATSCRPQPSRVL